LISAIAIATTDTKMQVLPEKGTSWSWDKADTERMEKMPKDLLPEDKNARISSVYTAVKSQLKGDFIQVNIKNKPGIQFKSGTPVSIEWKIATGLAQVYALRFNYMNTTGKSMTARIQLIASNGIVLKSDDITFPETKEKWRLVSTTTGSFINAGQYRVVLSGNHLEGLSFESLEVQ